VISIGFAINFIAGWKGYGVNCTNDRVIPYGFHANFMLFLIGWLNIKYMAKSNWLITWPRNDKN